MVYNRLNFNRIMKASSKIYAIILAGGIGKRFGQEGIPKQLVKIAGEPIIHHTLRTFQNCKAIDRIILVVGRKNFSDYKKIVKNNNFNKVIKIVQGGTTRQLSTRKGLDCIPGSEDDGIVLIHDAVRPFLTEKIILDVIEALSKYKAVDVGIPLVDTLVRIDKNKFIKEIPRRADFVRGQTPQGFRIGAIREAHKLSNNQTYESVTDDCGLVMYHKLAKIKIVDGEEKNIKITNPIDIHLADKLFQINTQENSYPVFIPRLVKNKKAVIFGFSSGIGKEIYKLYKNNGAIIQGYSRTNGVNVNKLESINRALDKFRKNHGLIDNLICTVGELKVKSLVDFRNEQIKELVSTNYTSQIILVKEAIKYMSRNSSITLFTSSSYTRGRMNYSIYSSSKAAIANFVQAMGEELLSREIRINAICPVRTNTPMRRKNFGKEDANTLLNPMYVAQQTIIAANTNWTGQIINIRKND